jgi:hypothetical protein
MRPPPLHVVSPRTGTRSVSALSPGRCASTHRLVWPRARRPLIVAALVQVALLIRFATQSSREVARFLDAISFDNTAQSFSGLSGDSAHRELGCAMTRVMDLLRIGRSEREAQVRYLQNRPAGVFTGMAERLKAV